MNELQLREYEYFKKVLDSINNELMSKGFYDIEYLLVNNSIDDIFNLLENESQYYYLVYNDVFSNAVSFQDMLRMYFVNVSKWYQSLYIQDSNNTVNKYMNKLKEPTFKNGSYVQLPKQDIGMIQSDVLKTLQLMKEAIIAYYKVYDNVVMLAQLTTKDPNVNDYLEFCIKEEQLLHLLGVTSKQLKNNPDFIRLTGNKNMNSVQILEWIIRDIEGNQDLAQLNEDIIKRVSNNNFGLFKDQYDIITRSRLLNYHKVRAKSQTFLKYGPYNEVSMVAKLGNGKTLAANSKSNTALVSRAEIFQKYPWAYFGFVQNPKSNYAETLIIDSSNNKKELFKGSKPAIIKNIYRVGTDSSSGSGINYFESQDSTTTPSSGGSENSGSGNSTPYETNGGNTNFSSFSTSAQFALFCKAYDAFKEVMDFKDLIEYFNNLELNNDLSSGKKR